MLIFKNHKKENEANRQLVESNSADFYNSTMTLLSSNRRALTDFHNTDLFDLSGFEVVRTFKPEKARKSRKARVSA